MMMQRGHASVDFEHKLAGKLAQRLIAGESSTPGKFRFSEVARGATDAMFFEQLRLLFDSSTLWEATPPSCRTVEG